MVSVLLIRASLGSVETCLSPPQCFCTKDEMDKVKPQEYGKLVTEEGAAATARLRFPPVSVREFPIFDRFLCNPCKRLLTQNPFLRGRSFLKLWKEKV